MQRVLIPALLIALLLAACGGGSDKKASETPTPPAAEVISKAADAATALQSFHFRFTNQNGTTPLPLNMGLETAEGDVAVPSKLSADVKAKAGGINVSVKVIGIDDQTWVTNPFTREWQKLPGATIRDFADPATLVISLLPDIKDPVIVGQTDIDGAKTYDVQGTIDAGALTDALGFARPGHEVKVEAWIGVDDSLPRRIKLTGALTSEEDANIVRQVDLSRFNQPVDIQPPK
jgi:hypothetical protein